MRAPIHCTKTIYKGNISSKIEWVVIGLVIFQACYSLDYILKGCEIFSKKKLQGLKIFLDLVIKECKLNSTDSVTALF